MKEEMNWVSLTDRQVEIEIDPEYNLPTGVVRFRGVTPSVTDTVNCTWSNFGDYKEDEEFDNKVYDEDNEMSVDEIAWAFGCRYAYVTEDATFYWR